jgi:anti-sigma28 factor (negative regulator of flagellin synthesis)
MRETMSQVNSVGNSIPIQQVKSPVLPRTEAEGVVASSSDKLELSGVSHLLKTLKSNDIRTDKVASVRAQIEAGTYENDDKMNVAIDRLLDDLTK